MQDKNPHDIQFSIEECTTCPYCSLIIENESYQADVKCYHFKVTHVPDGMKFQIQDRFLKPMYFIRADKGRFTYFGKAYDFSKDSIVVSNPAIGESFDFYLVSPGFNTFLRTSAVPYPIESKGKDGAYLSAVLLDLQGDRFLIEAKNFLPDEKIKFVCTSCDKVFIKETTFTNGEFMMSYAPGNIGQNEGVAKVEIFRADECLSIEIPWGKVYRAPKEDL